MRTSCPSCGTEVDTDDSRWCPNPDCGAYISWEEQDDAAAEAESTRRPGEQDEPPPPPEDPTTVIPTVEPRVACPACGTDNPEDRSLCERCGEPLRSVAPPPPSPQPREDRTSRIGAGWLVGGGIAVVLLVVLAFVLLGGDEQPADPVAEVSPSPTTSAVAATPPAPEESVTPSSSVAPVALETPTWVAVLRSMEVDGFDRAEAESHASSITDEVGADPGVLLSDDYSSLNPGYWVVYAGGFDDRDAADAFCEEVADTVPDCYARNVEE